ncbi:zeta toxin family protein [Massilia rubra]|uniref:Zeta toxin domain-containing protein n=1 Tax=Massilia rubra TaxID=2607910 RepID=A0ABX0LP22_9BURK|nr:zeta toxin family protein [Massilia rubra]NHZ33199.1 hypothetical protein [Massilia rubra]
MTKNYARPLLDHESIEAFLGNCLGIRHELPLRGGGSVDLPELCKRIRDAESADMAAHAEQTNVSRRNRVPQYRSDLARDILRRRVIEELIVYDRLDSDEEIYLGKGGAKPCGRQAYAGACAYVITGLPASGKSTLVSVISDRLGAMVLDSDFAKRKLPEFAHALAGAALVHEESRLLIFGMELSADASLLTYCMSRRLNVVIPLVGNDERRVKSMRHLLVENGYQVHLTAMLLDRVHATRRALDRFLQTGRYISLGMIVDRYANDPVLNYYKAWMDADTGRDSQWTSLGALAMANHPPSVHSYSSNANPAALWERTP